MAVAMKDLEIRGAGNLLGGEQSGHIAERRLRSLRADGRRGVGGGAR
jgi:RecG-like helicase